VIRGLDWKETVQGYIYLYEVNGNEGFIKIRYTTCDLNTRYKEWEFDCNRQPNVLYLIPTHSAMAVLNAR
jgi:hypothetical protein